jgi:hypothetical protein
MHVSCTVARVTCVHVAGTLPAAWSALSKLGTLRLLTNQLEGTLPAGWGSMALTELRLDSNRLQVRCGHHHAPSGHPRNKLWGQV